MLSLKQEGKTTCSQHGKEMMHDNEMVIQLRSFENTQWPCKGFQTYCQTVINTELDTWMSVREKAKNMGEKL